MVGIVLCREPGVAIFEIGELGYLIEFGLISKIGNEEYIETVFAGYAGITTFCHGSGAVTRKNNTCLVGK